MYSSKTQNVRSITIEPSDTWGGQGLLGISIRFCSFEGANENVWHILEVHPSSPADLAGLRPFTDYIIGADAVLHESEDLYTLVESHENRCLKLYVYNSQEDSCREVTITPNSKWGGEGSLGCGIGYGYLHRIPVRGNLPESNTATQVYTFNTVCSSANSEFVSSTDMLSDIAVCNQDSVSRDYAKDIDTFTTTNGQLPTQTLVTVPSTGEHVTDNLLTVSSGDSSNTNNAVPNTGLVGTNLSTTYSQLNSNMPVMYPNLSNAPYTVPSNMQPGTFTQFNQTPFNPGYFPPTSNLPSYNYTSESSTTPLLNSERFAQPLYTSVSPGTIPPPPLSGFQPQPSLVYDPTIAAMSAQKLLSSSNTSSPS